MSKPNFPSKLHLKAWNETSTKISNTGNRHLISQPTRVVILFLNKVFNSKSMRCNLISMMPLYCVKFQQETIFYLWKWVHGKDIHTWQNMCIRRKCKRNSWLHFNLSFCYKKKNILLQKNIIILGQIHWNVNVFFLHYWIVESLQTNQSSEQNIISCLLFQYTDFLVYNYTLIMKTLLSFKTKMPFPLNAHIFKLFVLLLFSH